MRHVLAVVSDLHTGSTLGLHDLAASPMDDGGEYRPSASQRWIWHHWVRYWKRVAVVARGAHLHVVVNGDLCDGDHHGTAQIVSRHPGVQMDIALRCFALVWKLRPASIVIVRGTEAHAGKSGATEEAFAKALHGQGLPVIPESASVFSHWHFVGNYADVQIDWTHHGRMGQRVWTKASVAANLAATIFYEHAAMKRRWPDLSIRSHYHKCVDTGDTQPVRLVQTPAWQIATAYVRKVAPDSLADIGGIIVTCDHGHAEVEKVIVRPDPTPTWMAP